MKNIEINNLFSDSDCLPEQKLLDYQNNKLSSKEKHLVEKHIANCNFCADALEGLALINNHEKIKKSLLDIDKAIDKYVRNKKPKTFTLSLSTKLAIAATIIIFIGISFLFTHYIKQNSNSVIPNNNIAQNIIQDQNNISPVSINDSENTKDVMTKNNGLFIPSTKESDVLEEVLKDKTIDNSKKVNQPKTPILDDRIEELETKKISENVFFKMPEKDKESDLVEENPEAEKPGTKTDTDIDKLKSGSDVKNDEINSEVVSGKKENNKKNKILKMEDIVNTKRNESKAPSAPNVQGNSVMLEIPYSLAIEKYNQKDYIAAKQLFEQILINDATNFSALYYKSLCCFYLDENENSILGFNKILKNKKNEYYEDAQWFKALVLIKIGDNKEAKKILTEIIKNNGIYKSNAEQKIKEI